MSWKARTHRIRTVQTLYGSHGDIWGYVSRPRHLEYLTPKWMKFDIQNDNEFDQIHLGLIIKYKIKTMPLIPYRYSWYTEITEMVEEQSFAYHQRRGPYKYWMHSVEVQSTDKPDTFQLVDDYEYVMPFGFIGEMARNLFVKRLLDEICEFRKDRLSELFPADKGMP